MKVIFNRNVDCDYFDHRMNETYPKYVRKWDEVKAESVDGDASTVTIVLYDGDELVGVPREAIKIGA